MALIAGATGLIGGFLLEMLLEEPSCRQESRPGERIGLVFMRLVAPLLMGPLRRFRPVRARTVAAAMVAAARVGRDGRQVHTYDDIVGRAR